MNDAHADDLHIPRERNRRLHVVGRVAAGAVIALIAVMWLYAASPWSRREPPATLENRSYAAAAAALCRDALAPIDDLPIASQARSPQERAQIIDQGNEVVADLVVRLRTLQPVGDHDTVLVEQWLDDWDELLRNRQAYADLLRAGGDEPFRVTGFDGVPLDASMQWFAKVNNMAECAPPGDV